MVAALLVALVVESALGRFLPGAARWVDVMLLPVIWFSVNGSPREGMLVGCSAGLLHDAWFEVGVLGLGGFKKTLVGWALATLSGRFDFKREGGLVLAGALGSLADSVLDIVLRDLLDRHESVPGVLEVLVRAVVAAGLLLLLGTVVARMQGGDRLRRM